MVSSPYHSTELTCHPPSLPFKSFTGERPLAKSLRAVQASELSHELGRSASRRSGSAELKGSDSHEPRLHLFTSKKNLSWIVGVILCGYLGPVISLIHSMFNEGGGFWAIPYLTNRDSSAACF